MNNYKDTPELSARMHSPLMERIVELKENFYAEADKYDYAPADFADAMDNFDRVLELTGSVCDEVIAPNAESVDREGSHCSGGRGPRGLTLQWRPRTVLSGYCPEPQGDAPGRSVRIRTAPSVRRSEHACNRIQCRR